jgi:hypothetical protein
MTYRILAVLALLFLAAFGAWMGHWVSDREPPTTVIRTELIPLKPYPGGEVQVRYFVRRYRACATRVERLLFDAQQLRIPLPCETLQHRRARSATTPMW